MTSNQCDGCMRKLPVRDGIHYDGDKPYMGCTKTLYVSEIKTEGRCEMTEEQKKQYLKNGGVTCPICRSDNIGGDSPIEFNAGLIHQKIRCHECGAEWEDEYDLVDVKDENYLVGVELISKGKKVTKLYSVVIEGDVEPAILDEYVNDEQRVKAARKYRKQHGDEDGLFRLNIDENGDPELESFGALEIDDV